VTTFGADPHTLRCALCLYARTGLANRAVTIIRGTAVCEDHMGAAAQGEEWAAMIRWAKTP
jgi:hypothetical protein